MQIPSLHCFEAFFGLKITLIPQTSTRDRRGCGARVTEDLEGQFQEVKVMSQLLHTPQRICHGINGQIIGIGCSHHELEIRRWNGGGKSRVSLARKRKVSASRGCGSQIRNVRQAQYSQVVDARWTDI